ncbi:hypothetical protein H9L39_17865 [Fusarium oxysporum f. sp. albedinis]|nr:hypothetical protein H9L39_17865 [Fusarium oxysporum f. sp. albedinis]
MRLPCVILTILLRHAQKKLAEENDQAKRHEAQVRSDPAYLNDLASRHNIRKKQLQQHIQDGNDWKRVCGQRDGLLPFIFLDTYNDFKIGKEQWLELGRQNDTGPAEHSDDGYISNLKDLFKKTDAFSGHELPCFTAASVEALLKNLPKLRVLELAPSGENKVAGNPFLAVDMLTRHRTKCFELSQGSDFPEDHHTMVVKGVLEGFMEYASCPGEFIWEKHYKLSKFKIGSDAYVIGSNLKHRKDWFEIRPVKVAKGDRAAMFQDVCRGKRPSQEISYYVPDSEWMNKVTKPNQRAQFS